MADKNDPKDNVKVYEPDRTLHTKIGHANLDQILTPEIIAVAQDTIVQSADKFLDESLAEIKGLERASEALRKAPGDAARLLPPIVNAAFSIKSKAALGGYDLVSSLAKSLQMHGEQLGAKATTARNIEIIDWHVDTIGQLLSGRVKGDGGAAGAAILAELGRLSAKNKG